VSLDAVPQTPPPAWGGGGRAAQAAAARCFAAAHVCPNCQAPLRANHAKISCPMGCQAAEQALVPRVKAQGARHSDRVRAMVAQMWVAGEMIRAICAATGLKTNQIVSLRRRMNLPQRPSPIRDATDPETIARRQARDRERQAAKRLASGAKPQKRAKSPTVAAARTPSLPGGTANRSRAASQAVPKAQVAPGDPLVVVSKQKARPHRTGYEGCQYIVGKGRFCDDAVDPGSPYCLEHSHLCFLNYLPAAQAA